MTDTRQTKRQIERLAAKREAGEAKRTSKIARRRALLQRQSVREKSDFYTGISVAAARAPSRSRLDKRKVQKAKAFGRIVRTITIIAEGGQRFEVGYHATKGWRAPIAA